MAPPFFFDRIAASLPNPAVIICLLNIADMIRISELSGADLVEELPDHYKLAPSMMSIKCRHGLDMEGFWPRDKFQKEQIIRIFRRLISLYSGKNSA
jgi:hypothetical protein